MVFATQLDRLLRPFDGRLEVAGFGIAGGQGAEDVWQLVLGQLAGLGGQLDGPFAVAEVFVGRGGQDPGQVVEHTGVVRIELNRFFVVGDGLGLFADAQQCVAPSSQGDRVVGLLFEHRRELLDGLSGFPFGDVEEGQLELDL